MCVPSGRAQPASEDSGNRSEERRSLIDDVAAEFSLTASITGASGLSRRVRQAMLAVPRHRFVPEAERGLAYANHPLPIGHRQTISQPFIVALMTQLLDVGPDHTVLEVGTGSGYQAAILATLARWVYSIEVVEPLAKAAADRLRSLGYDNVEVRHGDGARGWPEHAPFDRIIVTAAGSEIPTALIDQLAPGGRLVGPAGGAFSQQLVLVEKSPDGTISRRSVLPVAFVPLTHGE